MTFVAVLTTDEATHAGPSWDDVAQAIAALDARTRTVVRLAPGPRMAAHHLSVGGGGTAFVVTMAEDSERAWHLTDDETHRAEREVRLCIGGREGVYRGSQIVSRDLALRAARQYFEDGRRTLDLMWERA